MLHDLRQFARHTLTGVLGFGLFVRDGLKCRFLQNRFHGEHLVQYPLGTFAVLVNGFG